MSRQRLRPIRTRLLLLLAVIGPGIITANVDNDAGGITTYSVAGAQYGYGLLWMMPLVAVALIIVQEMSARLGVVSGKGLSALIREALGVRTTALILAILVLANLANTVSEFAGVAASMEIFGVSKYISVPLAAVGVWLLIVKGSYRLVERVFLVASALYLCYVASGVMAHPAWSVVARAAVTPQFHLEASYVVLAVTIIGTTIAPWMQFYQQSAIADKGLKPADYGYERLDVVVGAIFAIFVAAFITIACAATIFAQGLRIETAKDAALALGPLAGRYAGILFAFGLLNASVFSAAVLPLSTAYVVCEAFGSESGVSHSLREAPFFFGIYTALIVLGAGIILLPIKSLVQTMMASQTLNGVLLPIILVVMLRLINDRRLMGRFVNGRILNLLTWAFVIALIALTGILVLVSVFPGFLSGLWASAPIAIGSLVMGFCHGYNPSEVSKMAKLDPGEVRFIVNPVAGAGAVGRLWPTVLAHLEGNWGRCDWRFTEGPLHGVELARQAAEEEIPLVVAVGGDGTANEVACGLLSGPRGPDFLPQAVLGIMPLGTGSDLRRTLDIPRDYRAACQQLRAGRARIVDVGEITWGKDGKLRRYFVNIAGLGFDGEVVERVERKSKALGGTLPYLLGLFQTLAGYSNKDIELGLDGEKLTMRVNAVMVCNGCYAGGGMFIAPGALVDDGLFQVVVIGDLDKLELVVNIPRVYRGTHLTHPKVSVSVAREVEVASRERMLIQADGESIGECPAHFSLKPQALKVWVPAEEGK